MNDETNNPDSTPTQQKLYGQTALITWKELQRFFAQGVVMWVDEDCDLIEIGTLIAEDEAEKIEALLESAKFATVSNEQAKNWFAQDATLWSLVVAPFVLVQERAPERDYTKS